MNNQDIEQIIDSVGKNGQAFSVKFKKKNGEIREINCRLKVKKHLRGGQLPYDPKEVGTKIVFDLQKKDYRSFSLDSILEIRGGGAVFTFKK